MKYILLFTLLSFARVGLAQQIQTFELQFYLMCSDSAKAIPDTLVIDITQTNSKLAINYRDEELEDRFVIDMTVKKVLELTNASGEKKAFLTDMLKDTYRFGITKAHNLVNAPVMNEDWYRLLPESRTIQGWDCRKVAFLCKDGGYGTGWVALGLHVAYNDGTGFSRIREGSVIEYTINHGGKAGFVTLKLVKSSATITQPERAFSLDIPVGYMLEEYNWEK